MCVSYTSEERQRDLPQCYMEAEGRQVQQRGQHMDGSECEASALQCPSAVWVRYRWRRRSARHHEGGARVPHGQIYPRIRRRFQPDCEARALQCPSETWAQERRRRRNPWHYEDRGYTTTQVADGARVPWTAGPTWVRARTISCCSSGDGADDVCERQAMPQKTTKTSTAVEDGRIRGQSPRHIHSAQQQGCHQAVTQFSSF